MSTEDAWYMADKLREVLEAKNFNKDDFDTRAFKLSQAFCLLWQDKDTGEVSGRQRSGKTANAAVVAVLIDLFILGKIEFEALVKQWTSMRRKREIIYVKVIDTSLTGTYLDKALFTSMLSYHNAKPDEPKTVTEWIIQGSCLPPTCATNVLDSLVEAKILGKTSVMFWKKFPTLNAEPETQLVQEIRRIALLGHIADGYMWTLIKLLCDIDNNTFTKGSLLSRHFSAEESPKAKSHFTTLFCIGESCVDARKLNVEFHELQDLSTERKQHEQRQAQGEVEQAVFAEAGASCALRGVNLVDKEELSSSTSVEEPEKSQLLHCKHKDGADNKKQ
ncbi:hypothetical protein QZH41_010556 [Actinostola sp. cb2023]|nr:hypothetical protein QZH41_010556 [Actinostola sp. cb2023]